MQSLNTGILLIVVINYNTSLFEVDPKCCQIRLIKLLKVVLHSLSLMQWLEMHLYLTASTFLLDHGGKYILRKYKCFKVILRSNKLKKINRYLRKYKFMKLMKVFYKNKKMFNKKD